MTIERVAFISNDKKSEAYQLREEIEGHLADKGVTVAQDKPDLVIALGGDGTMLRAAGVAHAADALLLGVNLGRVGYLTETDPPEVRAAVARILEGDHQIEERMMLEADSDDGSMQGPKVGLNEVLVERSHRHRMVRLEVKVGSERLGTFHADGVIVATPTGSTAYAMSAGGPVISPRAECLLVVPVSPHMVFSRPVVLAPDETVEITVAGDSMKASVSLDGDEGCILGSGATVRVARHPRPLKLVRLAGPGFIERLRSKLAFP